MNTPDISLHHFIESRIGDFLRRTKKGIQRSIADQNVNCPIGGTRGIHQIFKLLLIIDIAGDSGRLQTFVSQFCRHGVTSVLISAGNDHSGTLLRHPLSNCLSYSLGRSRNQCNFAFQVE